MKFSSLVFVLVIIASTANAATTNLNNNRINTYDLFAEGHATIGSTWNTTEWGLVVVNGTTLNSTLRVQGNAYFEGPVDFNGTVSGVQADSISSGTISRTRLPTELAYEDEANTFAIRQSYLDGVSVAKNAYTTALLQSNGTFAAQTNGYHNGPALFNDTLARGTGATAPTGSVQFHTDTVANNVFFSASGATAGISPNLIYQRSRGTLASPSDVVNGDQLGTYIVRGYSGGTYFSTAEIDFLVDGTFTSGQRPPSKVVIYTNVANGAVTPRLTISGDGTVLIGQTIELDGALNHDGTTVGFYGKTPVVQAADIVQMTDNTGGTITSTCAAIAAGVVYAQADMVAVKNCLASLIAKINAMDTLLDDIGMTA